LSAGKTDWAAEKKLFFWKWQGKKKRALLRGKVEKRNLFQLGRWNPPKFKAWPLRKDRGENPLPGMGIKNAQRPLRSLEKDGNQSQRKKQFPWALPWRSGGFKKDGNEPEGRRKLRLKKRHHKNNGKKKKRQAKIKSGFLPDGSRSNGPKKK